MGKENGRRTNGWHRTKRGALTRTLGERGYKVRIFERLEGRGFYRGVYKPGIGKDEKGREDQRPLHTTDHKEALRQGRLLLAELIKREGQPSACTPLTLRELWRRYSTECEEYTDNKEKTKKDSAARARILLAYFGTNFRVEDLSKDRQRAYENARLAGGIVLGEDDVTEKTRARSAELDVSLLHTMLHWATNVRLPTGDFLLQRNPLQGVKRVREKNKKQPIATWERYEATIAVMRQLRADAGSDDERLRWVRMELALFLAESTGKRIGSIRHLRWEDFNFARGVVTWRSESDKKGYDWRVPMPADFFDTVRGFQREIGAIAGYVFAANSGDGVLDRHTFEKGLRYAEKKAKLPHLDGGLWHSYRRKWATERKHLPLKDVAKAGGWKDVNSLLGYQQVDDASVLVVTSSTLKLRERVV